MTRHFLMVLICLSPLAVVAEAVGRTPDQVAHSPIPPLKVRTARNETRRDVATKLAPARLTVAFASEAASSGRYDDKMLDPSRADIWESEAMQEARAAVWEFGRRSAQVRPYEVEQFLQRLSQLPVADMQDWLERYQARRATVARGEIVARQTRRAQIEQSLERAASQRSRDSYLADLRSRDSSLASVPQVAQLRIASKPFSDSSVIAAVVEPDYNPLELVFDPSSPRGRARLFAAAISLPAGE